MTEAKTSERIILKIGNNLNEVLIISTSQPNYFPMKVVHVFWGLYFGGIETMLVNIANAQAVLGADVSINH